MIEPNNVTSRPRAFKDRSPLCLSFSVQSWLPLNTAIPRHNWGVILTQALVERELEYDVRQIIHRPPCRTTVSMRLPQSCSGKSRWSRLDAF